MDPIPSPVPTPAPDPNPAPPPAPVAATRPDWLPEPHWDGEKGAIKPEFGAHYSELTAMQKADADRKAALPKTADEYKIEVKLPEDVNVPDGFQVKIDDKDPRVPLVRALAYEQGWSQDTLNAVVALDARMKIAEHAAEQTRVATEDAKLGAKAPERKAAVTTWLKGMAEAKAITAAELDAGLAYATDAASVTLFEKLMAKAAGTVPGNTPAPPPTPAPATIEQRWFGQKKG